MSGEVNNTFPTNLQFPKTAPALGDLLDLRKKDVLLSLFCHGIATITSFDPVTQTASADMVYAKTFVQRQADGSYIGIQRPYPPLSDCPVIFLGGKDSYLNFPDVVGSDCLVHFNDRDIDNWLVDEGQVLNSSRLHSFSDPILVVGIRSHQKAIQDFDLNRVVLKKGNAEIRVGLNNELIRIANEQYTLNGLLQQLISELQSLSVAGVSTGLGVSGPPLNAPAIAAIGAQLNQLLE